MPVLAIFAPEVATGTGDAQSEMAGKEVIDRCFFNGSNIHNRRFPINDAI
jgi:hypothetical protein